MSYRVLIVTSGLLVAACGRPSTDADTAGLAPAPRPTAVALASITAADMRARIGVLAHDSMRGRDTPSPGLEAAARYVSGEFRRMGLRGGVGGGYIQRYPFPRVALDLDQVRLAFLTPAGPRTLALGTEFLAVGGEPARASGGLVFLGSAAVFTAAAGSLRDRVAVVYLPGPQPDRNWRMAGNRARRVAQAAGASAVIAALDPAFPADAFAQLNEALSRPARRLGDVAEIPLLYGSWAATEPVFQAAGLDAAELPRRAEAGTMAPVPLPGVTAELAAPTRTLDASEPPNVVAILPGRDPALRETYVVFSAHMDHVGVGRPDASGDSIYNGADDNASGTSALLEIAEAFTRLDRAPLRSLVFLAVSGEEKGLLGSRWFAEHPTVPLDRVVANVNMDMIARNAPDTIVVIGQEYSSLGPLVHAVAAENAELALVVARDPWPEERFFFRSDHFNFARKEIPALFFFAGVHEDYHRPSDEVEKIDANKAARVARLAFLTAYEIASRPDAPVWTEQGLAEVRALMR